MGGAVCWKVAVQAEHYLLGSQVEVITSRCPDKEAEQDSIEVPSLRHWMWLGAEGLRHAAVLKGPCQCPWLERQRHLPTDPDTLPHCSLHWPTLLCGSTDAKVLRGPLPNSRLPASLLSQN